MDKDLSQLEQQIGYEFKDPQLLLRALTHRSFAFEKPARTQEPPQDLIRGHYERLEFLGDAVVDLVIGHLLMQRFPDILEGDLSKLRARLVNIKQLSNLAKKLGLDRWVRLGKGEDATGGRDKASILSDTYEAVCAAVYLDGGFDAAFSMIQGHFQDILLDMDLSLVEQDYKTKLQELVQAQNKRTPKYRLLAEHGPDHAKSFEIQVVIAQKPLAIGYGSSKKEAEQDAAQKALAILENPDKINHHG